MRQASELVERCELLALHARRVEALIARLSVYVQPGFNPEGWLEIRKADLAELLYAAQSNSAIDAIIPDDPTLAKRIVDDFDKDQWEKPPVHERPGDYRPEEDVVGYLIRRVRGERR